MKHFSQKWYLSARSPYFGELHVRHQHSQSQRGHEEAATNQGRAGQAGGADTQEEAEGKVGRRQEEAANRDAGFLCWVGVLILRVNFGVDDWSHQNRPMQTSQALKNRRERRGRRGREMKKGREGQK